MTSVRDRMTAAVISVGLDTSSAELLRLFAPGAFSALPVIDANGRLAGVVSTTDMVRKVVAAGETSRARASDLMTAPAIVATPSEPLDEAVWRLVAARTHRLVVVEDDKAVGILSVRDVLGALLHRHIEGPISAIMSSPVETLPLGTSIAEATQRLSSAKVHGLVVVDNDVPVGVFTHAEALAAERLPSIHLEDPVEEVMSYETTCFNLTTPIHRVAEHACKMHVRRVLVVDHKRIVGIVSDVDLVAALSRAGS